MIEYMEIGPTPCEEDCAQVGENDFRQRASKEMDAYINLLYRKFPQAEDKGITFKKKWFQHDFGTYGEVCIYWNTDDSEADEFAYEIERNLPDVWDREAMQELGLELSRLESKDNPNWG